MDKSYISKKELWMFSVGAMGQGMIYSAMSGFISDYYINVLALTPWFGFWLMLLARVWDAINDPLMGIIADRHSFRKSKYKPYILITALPIAVLTFFMFYTPDAIVNRGDTAIMAFCAVVYILWGMIYTMSDVPFWSLPNAITPDAKERGSVISLGRTLNGIGSAVPTILNAVMGFLIGKNLIFAGRTANEQEKYKYLVMALVAAVIGIILFLSSYPSITERVRVEPKKKTATGEHGSLYNIFHCKPLMLVVAMGVLSSGRYLMQCAAPHVARYCFLIEGATAEEAQTQASLVFTILQVCSAAGMFGAMLFMPALMKKIDYKKIVITSCLGGFAASILTTIIGYTTNNVIICAPFILIQCIPLGVINVVSYAMIGDCLDYMELESGYRDNALGSACQGFVNKLGNALATCTTCLMYLIANIDTSEIVKSKDSLITVTSSQSNTMFLLISILPGLCLVLCTIPMFFYKISGDSKQEMLTKLAERREKEGTLTML